MRRILPLLFISLFTGGLLRAQTVFYTEDFSTAGAGWNFNFVTGPEGADPNFWKSSAEEGGNIPPNLGAPGSCGVPNNGNNCLFVTSVFNPSGGAAYDAGGACGILFCPQTDRRTESPVINCTGKTNISVNFEYIESGDGTNDDATLWYNDGTGFVLLDNMPKTLVGCSGQGLWVTRTVALPASADNNPIVQIAFRWVNNDDGVGTDPSIAVDNITLSVPAAATPSLAITPLPNDTICQSATLTLNGTVTANGPITNWAWTVSPTPGVVFVPDTFDQNPTVTFTTPGTYTFTLFGTNASPSTGSTTQVITVLPTVVPSVTVSPDPASGCPGTSIIFTATATNGGAAPAFQWTLNGSSTGLNSSIFTLSNIAGGEQVSVILTSNAACVTPVSANSNTVTVTTLPQPTVTVTHGTATVCPGIPDTLITTATAGSTFSWTPSGGLNVTANDSVIATNAAIGIYTYYVTATLGGCTKTDSVQVTVSNTGLIATAGPSSTVCAGQSAPLSVTGGTAWLWTPAGGNIVCDTCQNTTATPTATTTYSVLVSKGGCSATVTETITVIPNASGSFNTSSTSGIPQTVTFTNTSSNAIGYFWNFGDNLTSVLQTPAPHTYNAAGTYTVVLIAYGQNGCNDTLPAQLIIVDTVGITVPNIFTPNGDNINDVWQPNIHGAKDFECTIYNRWGLKVYEFAGDQDHWDGHTTAGLMCQDGTYYYILKTNLSNNKSYNLKGYIQLIQ